MSRASTSKNTSDASIEIYVGAPVEYQSERLALQQLIPTLKETNCRAVILANIHLSGRQIDIVVATESSVLVVEAGKEPLGQSGAVRAGRGKS